MGFSRLVRDFAIRMGPVAAPVSSKLLRPPLFVVGFNKSAKSMIVDGLAKQPGISVFPGEGNNKLWFRDFYPFTRSSRSELPLWYRPQAFVDGVLESRPDHFRETQGQLGVYQLLRAPANRLLVDSGMLAATLPDIMPTFPDAKVLHVVRDGRVVSNVAAKKTLARIAADRETYEEVDCPTDAASILEAQAHYWCWTLDRVAEAARLFPGSVKVVRYEDWCADPGGTLSAIAQFLGIDRPLKQPAWDDEIVNSNDDELAGFSESDINRVEQIQAPHLKKFGYLT